MLLLWGVPTGIIHVSSYHGALLPSGMGGVHDNIVTLYTASAAGLPPSEVTFPEILKEAGYTNALIGKQERHAP